MSEDQSRKRLGRGLAALIGEIDRPAAPEKPSAAVAADGKVPIEFVSPNPKNPRRHFGDAELTEQGIMALSAHSTPDAARAYVKKTERQRLAAARKRRAWVEQEQNEAKSQNEEGQASQNDCHKKR